MTATVNFVVSPPDAGARLDSVVVRHLDGISRALAHALIEQGRVRVNGSSVKASKRLATGDAVEVEVVVPPSLSVEPESIPLRIVYCDDDLAVVDKPAGLVVHPAPGHAGGTLANALVALFSLTSEAGFTEARPGIVHRLDKDTSGLMVVALSVRAQKSLQEQIASRSAQRRYVALASGQIDPPTGIIDAPVGRDPKNRLRMATYGIAARSARTRYDVIEALAGFTLLTATLDTGRTHQIRVHFAAIGHPLAGDKTYGGPPLPGLARQFLHANELVLSSPSTGEEMRFSSPLPADLTAVLDHVRRR
ncbi:MAG: RluA family pseudouridine synthase [Chloroflexota bacterium]